MNEQLLSQLERLAKLREQGVLTQEELERQKAILLSSAPAPTPPPALKHGAVVTAQPMKGKPIDGEPKPIDTTKQEARLRVYVLAAVGVLLLIILLVRSCGNPDSDTSGLTALPVVDSVATFNTSDNPTQRAHSYALRNGNFLREAARMKKHKRQQKAIQAQVAGFDKIDRVYDSLNKDYNLRKDSLTENQILKLEEQFRAWEIKTDRFIDKNNLWSAFQKYNGVSNTKASASAKSTNVSSSQTALEDEVKIIMSASATPFLMMQKADSGCLWVYTTDNGRDRDGLAQTICYTASKYYYQCVTIVDQNQRTLGRSQCR